MADVQVQALLTRYLPMLIKELEQINDRLASVELLLKVEKRP